MHNRENLPFILIVLIAGKVEHILWIHLDVGADFIKGVVILVLGFRLVIIWDLVRCLVCTKLSIYTWGNPQRRVCLTNIVARKVDFTEHALSRWSSE
jgi:hypothetical protein